MQPRSFDDLAREWGSQTKDFLTLLGDVLTQRIKAKLPLIIGGGVYGALAIIFAFFVLSWLTFAGYQTLISLEFSPLISSLITSGSCLVLSGLALFILKMQFSRSKEASTTDDVVLTETGKDLLTLSKDIAKSTLDPKMILKQQAGRIVAASVVIGFLVGMSSERAPAPQRNRR
ncbi:MAG: hypothetical protein H7301_02365 [Cryobacterium sp.]|nr:hypothetical protein [Oligoflexia bacterium]